MGNTKNNFRTHNKELEAKTKVSLPTPNTDIDNNLNDLVGAVQAAKLVHLSIQRFYTIHKLHFPQRKQGKKILFSKQELYEYLTTGEVAVFKRKF